MNEDEKQLIVIYGDSTNARAAIAFDAAGVPTESMYMPAGVHTIDASRAGKPCTATIEVNPRAAEILQMALDAHRQAGQKPYFDFDHKKEAASGWPLRFYWKDGANPGVYAAVEWSKPGAEAISGKAYRAFSPSFFEERGKSPAGVIGAPLCMGSLVNSPAFETILPLWAKKTPVESSGPAQPSNQQTKMTDQELAALQAKLQQLEKENAELKAKQAGSESADAIKAKDTEIATLKTQLTAAQDAITAQRKKDADTAVQAAVARGALEPKNEAIQAKWRGLIEADPKNAELLAAMPGNPALAGKVVDAKSAKGQQVEVVAIDYNDALAGFLNARNPRDRGWIYYKELHARLNKGERIPFERVPIDAKQRVQLTGLAIEAVNTLGELAGDIVAQRTLALLYSLRPALTSFVNDFSDQRAVFTQQVVTRTIGLPTVQNFGAAASAAAVTDYPVKMDQLKQVMFNFLTTEYLATGRDLVKEHSEANAVALGNYIVDAVVGLIKSGAGGFALSITKASANVSYTDLIEFTRLLNVAKVPDQNRFGFVDSNVAESFKNDEIVMANYDRATASAYGHWKNLEGFQDLWEYPELPTTNIATLTGFFGHRDTMLVASRVPTDPQALVGAGYPGRLAEVTDPISGLTVLSNFFIGQSDLSISMRLIVMFGCALGNVGAGAYLKSA